MHLKIRIAVLEIEPPKQFFIKVGLFWIVLIATAENAVERLLTADDRLTQPVFAERAVTNERDTADERRVALLHLEHDVDPVLVQPNDLRFDRRGKASTLGIGVKHALPVGLYQLRRVNGPGAQLQFGLELIIRQLTVTFERDPVNDRILDDPYH